MLTDDAQLVIVGDQTFDGKQSIVDSMDLFLDGISEVTVENIIPHDDKAAVSGVIIPDNGDTHAFCEVFKFEGDVEDTNIKSIDSYVIEIA